ncbi:BZ3500_MvSof-1268-A1-R1_Chr2-3g05235 [Microbotryum saponariae]|uniref:BZ3500_MvSof-1268-A1-R1_Chr2-3g05235 protein n=1 Tax=Microbotryum saponariae TaxID=289078 RepID=A0A2X0L3A5_9BASI|nr:BZ3500_MvSof-1268-A1-R1_Chr2-3g05235 [Microbotryum saponariae]SDA01061.1 BZ3501_MvSof-1269-A2-R1_Chr2-2g04908 [Microbotryum saponariae]
MSFTSTLHSLSQPPSQCWQSGPSQSQPQPSAPTAARSNLRRASRIGQGRPLSTGSNSFGSVAGGTTSTPLDRARLLVQVEKLGIELEAIKDLLAPDSPLSQVPQQLQALQEQVAQFFGPQSLQATQGRFGDILTGKEELTVRILRRSTDVLSDRVNASVQASINSVGQDILRSLHELGQTQRQYIDTKFDELAKRGTARTEVLLQRVSELSHKLNRMAAVESETSHKVQQGVDQLREGRDGWFERRSEHGCGHEVELAEQAGPSYQASSVAQVDNSSSSIIAQAASKEPPAAERRQNAYSRRNDCTEIASEHEASENHRSTPHKKCQANKRSINQDEEGNVLLLFERA